MEILLLGEFSGFYSNLSEGLLELDHEVTQISSGDGWKKIFSDSNNLYSNNKNIYLRMIQDVFIQLTRVKNIKNFDVVQLINPSIFRLLRFGYNQNLLKIIARNNQNIFLSVAAIDYYTNRIYNTLRYSPLQDKILNKDNYSQIRTSILKNTHENHLRKNNDAILNLVKGIIPTTYTYAEAYRNHPKLLNTIPFAINVDKIKFEPQKIKNKKLRIFHGLNREDFKGTKYIKEAMLKLKQKYPNDVEIIIDGRMPLKKYLKVLKETNVIVDQALSYEYGMNAVYSMAMGKVVLSGNEPECQLEFGRSDVPIINITPSVDDIFNKLEKLVLDKQSVIEKGYKSRKFTEDFHHYVKVAQQYLDTWNRCIKDK